MIDVANHFTLGVRKWFFHVETGLTVGHFLEYSINAPNGNIVPCRDSLGVEEKLLALKDDVPTLCPSDRSI